MKWCLPKRARSTTAAMPTFAAIFDGTVQMAEEWQSLLARITQAMELVQQGETIPRDEAAMIGDAARKLCLDLSGLIANCRVTADSCRSLGESDAAEVYVDGAKLKTRTGDI